MPVSRSLRPATLIASVAFSLVIGAAAWAQSAPPPRPAAPAATDGGGPAWSTLTQPQRRALAPLEKDWAHIDASRKQKWLEIAARYPTMPESERQRMQERMAEWARLSPTERGKARLSYQEAKQLSPQERQARWEAYQALPEDQRKALADRAQPQPDKPRLPASAPLVVVPKQNLVASAPAKPTAKPVAPTVVQASPGATTRLMTRPAAPPAHHQPGQPKIAATPNQVDRSTLLPKRGPQAAATLHAASASSAPAQP